MRSIAIDGRLIGSDHPPYIVAELSANHNGSLERALKTIDSAKIMGADAVKLQTYTAETMTIDCDMEEFRIRDGLWDGYTLYELYRWAQTPFEWQEALFERGREVGISIFSTPFDETAVDLLETLDAPAYKIASFEVVDHALIARTARTGKPLIISTGMATLAEIGEAVAVARDNGCRDLVLLHCISSYPAPADQANLRTIPDLAERFDTVVGLSDHTLGTAVAVAGVSLGAALIEKHYTLDRTEAGPDAAFSIEPDELKRLCTESRQAWEALGAPGYELKPAEANSKAFRRSLYVVADVAAGETLTRENVRCIRPGHGLAPKHLETVLGRSARRALRRGTALAWDMIE